MSITPVFLSALLFSEIYSAGDALALRIDEIETFIPFGKKSDRLATFVLDASITSTSTQMLVEGPTDGEITEETTSAKADQVGEDITFWTATPRERSQFFLGVIIVILGLSIAISETLSHYFR